MKSLNYILATLAFAGLSACESFTDTVPKQLVIPTTMEDFEGMIIDPSLSTVVYPLADISSDDVFLTDEYVDQTVNGASGRAYFWMKNFYMDHEDDSGWNTPYRNLYQINIVIQNIMSSSGGTEKEKKRILAEAKIARAYCLWVLQSYYASAYDKKTAGTGLSVPLALVPDLDAKYSRATIQEVTDAILNDLNGIADDLPNVGSNSYKPTKASAYAMLARVYFYMGEYDKAAEQADKTLQLNNKLNDMTTWAFKNEARPSQGVNNMPQYKDSPETIWLRECGMKDILGSVAMSDDLASIYDVNDLRLKFYFTKLHRNGDAFDEVDGKSRFLQNVNYCLTVPEMMLIKAEALARKGNMEALTVLNDLRRSRFTKESYTLLTATGKEELLAVVLNERRRELSGVGGGLRWLDMKRLCKEGLYKKTLKRSYKGTEYVLEPNSKLYVFPIPGKVIGLNPNIIQNER